MALQQVPVSPELFISLLVMLLPIALLYIGYKLVQGFRAFEEGRRDA